MAEQRQAFRFRLPWLIQSEPSAPPPPRPPPLLTPPPTTQNSIPPTPTQRPTTTNTTSQNTISPTPTQRPPTTSSQTPVAPTPALKPPTTTQTPILPTPTTQRPPNTTTQTPTAPTPSLRPPNTIQPQTPTTQRPPATATAPTPPLRPPTTTQTPIPPTPTTQRPPTTTTQPLNPLTSSQRPPATTQTPIPPIPTQRPSTTTTTQIPNSPNPTQRPLSNPLGLAPVQPPPPPPASQSPTVQPPPASQSPIVQPPPASQSPTGTEPKSPLVKIPNNQSNQPTNITQTSSDPPSPATPPQRPPLRPVGTTQSQTSSPNAQASPKNKSQPSSPFRASTQSQANSQPKSPSRIATQSRVSSQPASPSRVGTQSKVPPKSPSPSGVATQSRSPSQPSSPSRGMIQSRTASQPSSPSRKQPSQTGSLPRSPSRLASQATGQISSSPSSPAITSTKIEPKGNAVEQPPSFRTMQQIGQETSPPNFSDPKPLVSEKEETKITQPLSESQESQSNTETTIDTNSNTHNSHKLSETETTSQPNIPTNLPQMSEKSDSIPSSSNLALLLDKPEGKKEPREKIADFMVEYGDIHDRKASQFISKISGFMVQKDQRQPEKQLHTTEKNATSISTGKQTNTATPHSVDKIPVRESHQKPIPSDGAQVPLHKEIKDDISKFAQKMATANPKKPMGENPMSVITIAGENRGAFMHLGSDTAKREGAVHIRRGYKNNPDESGDTTDGEGRKLKESITSEDSASKAYVNNNTQGVNNSIVFNSSITQGNPGVHVRLARYLSEPNKSDQKQESLDSHKAEYNITPAQKMTYEPTVRRRCLRGLFMESSDSDDDNPEKPRRHGCRYSCGMKSKDGDIDVL